MLQSDSSESFHSLLSQYLLYREPEQITPRKRFIKLHIRITWQPLPLLLNKIRSITNIKYHWKLRDRGSFALAYTRPCLQITSTWNASCDIAISRVSNVVWMYAPHASGEPNLLRYNWLPLYYIHASKRWEPIFMHSRSGEVGKLFLFQLNYVLHTSNIMLRSRKRFGFRLAALQRQ